MGLLLRRCRPIACLAAGATIAGSPHDAEPAEQDLGEP
jgi:hypothetical protein